VKRLVMPRLAAVKMKLRTARLEVMFAPTCSWPQRSAMLQDPAGTELPAGRSIDFQSACAGVLYVCTATYLSAPDLDQISYL
jgi:hypothetical protein